MDVQVVEFIKQALECSVFLSPLEPGLTADELIEIGSRLNVQRGQVLDGIPALPPRYEGRRIQMPQSTMLSQFFMGFEPDFRNVEAFAFVIEYLLNIGRVETMARAMAPRDVIVANGVAAGHKRDDLQAAITIYLHEGHLVLRDGMITFASGRQYYPVPTKQAVHNRLPVPRPRIDAIREVVRDVIQRRGDGRPAAAEPLTAFDARLDSLGHGRFKVWWASTRSELHLANPATSPISVCVLAAALSEAALTFVVKHARTIGSPTLASRTFSESPTRWSFDELLKSAASGGADAILDQSARDRADRLFWIRQRIHAGRLLADQPQGPIPDTRPEEAREAIETANIVVRKVLDWLDRHPV